MAKIFSLEFVQADNARSTLSSQFDNRMAARLHLHTKDSVIKIKTDARRGRRMVVSPIADTLKCVISAQSAQHEKNDFETDNELRDLDNGERTAAPRHAMDISGESEKCADVQSCSCRIDFEQSITSRGAVNDSNTRDINAIDGVRAKTKSRARKRALYDDQVRDECEVRDCVDRRCVCGQSTMNAPALN